MIIRVRVSTDKVGSECETEFDLEDDCSEAEIEEFARDAMFQMISWTFEKVPQ